MRCIASIDFDDTPASVARALIGTVLLVDGIGGRIVETEAYDADDPASHSHNGLRPRNAAMFGPAGHAYVYRSYGLHWCMNIVCRPAGHGAAVLIRALEPTAGLPSMQARRGLADTRLLCAGPGRLAQAMGITYAHNGLPVDRAPFELQALSDPSPAAPVVVVGRRIGISKAQDQLWRFGLAGSAFISKRFTEPGGRG